MVSLYKRALPSQRRLLRIVEGAIKNAADAHTDIQVSARHRRSIAKRAVGTISSQWPEIVGAGLGDPSSDTGGVTSGHRFSKDAESVRSAPPAGQIDTGRKGGERLGVRRRSPFKRLISAFSRPIKQLKLDGKHEQAAAYVEVLKLIDAIRIETGDKEA